MNEQGPQDRQRAKWRQNKQAARRRAAPAPRPVPDDLLAFVMAERDRRAVADHYLGMRWRHAHYTKKGTIERACAFVADVWAGKTLLEWQLGVGKVKPTRVARWLAENGRTHGYASSSLRVMVHRALGRIQVAETAPPTPWVGWAEWSPVDLHSWEVQSEPVENG